MRQLILSLYSDKKCSKFSFSKSLENMLNITTKVNAYGCRPQSGRNYLNQQWYRMVHFMMRIIVLIIYA